MRTKLLAVILFLTVAGPNLRASDTLHITEFMAANSSTLADEDGAFSDWIEIHNAGTNSVNLLNWCLTDDALNLAQWRFPAVNLEAGGYLIVFASGKNRRGAASELHTNFKLANGGDYLALLEPDGATVASQFSPVFPPQVDDVSYGLDSGFRRQVFLPSNSVSRLLVPVDGALGTNWIGLGFDDSNWLGAAGGVGFEAGSIEELRLTNNLAGYWKFDETNGQAAADSSGLGNSGALRNFPLNGSQWVTGRFGRGLQFRGGSDYVFITNYPKSTTVLTLAAWVWAEARPTWATIAKNWPGGNASHFHFGLQDNSGDLSNFIRQNNADYGLREGTVFPLGSWQHVAFTLDASTERLYRNGVLVNSAPYTGSLPLPTFAPLTLGAKLYADLVTADSFWNGKMDEVAVWNRALSPAEIQSLANPGGNFGGLIHTDIKHDMHRRNATCYLRFPVVVENPGLYQRWTLQVRYNDGFVAWLNGEEIARRNAPETLAWNSSATNLQPASLEEATFNLAEFEHLFVAGTNVLAFQALNLSAENPDFFIAPTLEALSSVTVTNSLAYFTTPTPGSVNLPGVTELGPILAGTTHAPAVPANHEDLSVTVRVSPTFAAVTNVTLRYRVMYSNEVAIPMFDDGAHGDGAAMDGSFGAVIPASAATNGQMIRYAITAADNHGRLSRTPAFMDPNNSDEYYGTVVATPLTTPLPVFHWFVANPAAAETSTGTRCSLFYDGEFYDNIFIRIRGGTAIGWPKKSYKVELNEEHEFRLRPGMKRVTEFDLNATYTDKSYARAVLSSEHQRDAGLPTPEILHIHLRQNTAFYSVALYVDTVDLDFVEKWGMDRAGALYKGGPGSTMDTVASYEKKNYRTVPNKNDLQAFLSGLQLTGPALENFVFDHVDVPELINYMATMAVTQDIDGTDKNHYLRRDTLGSGEWRLLPWDLDLTFGPDALNTDTIVYQLQNVNAPACASHPFIGARPYMLHAGKYQRLIEALVNTPRTRAMILRRTRTLTEQFLTTSYFQNRIEQLYTLLNADVTLDRQRWGSSAHFGGLNYTFRASLDRIKNEYLALRPGYLLGTNIAGVGLANPPRQPFDTVVGIFAVESNPISGRQEEEFLCLTNANPYPVEISGWKLAGGVDFTFAPATVIPSNSVLYVARNVAAFRARSTGPRGGQGLFVQGNFSGQLSARGEWLRLVDTTGHAVSSFAYAGDPSPAQQFLRITELMYHPSSLAGNTNDADEFEYIELRNISTNIALSLTGVRLTNGVDFNFTGSSVTNLLPGERVLVVRNLPAFLARYGGGRIAGEYSGSLANNGERLQLLDASHEEILDFSYHNTWHPLTDGHGFSLVVVNETAAPDAWGNQSQWRTSGQSNGNPGSSDPGASAIATVLINEVLSRTDLPPPTDSIELFNPSSNAADLSGWFLTDDLKTPGKFRIPDGTVIPAGGYRVFTENDFNPAGTGFALGSDGDEVWLFSADAAGQLTGWLHGFRFGAADDGVTFGRHLISTGEEHFTAQAAGSLNGSNTGPRVGPVVISEIHYHPDFLGDEFVELHNTASNSVPLFDPINPTNTWRLQGVGYQFPTNLTLAADQRLLMVGGDPVSFRARHGVPAGVEILPLSGQLEDDGELLELLHPATPPGSELVYVTVDAVRYNDQWPWPAGADGQGPSLQRIAGNGYGNDPINWLAAAPTPGRPAGGGEPPLILAHPPSQRTFLGQTATLSVGYTGSEPMNFRWHFNGAPLAGATNRTLNLTNFQISQVGYYQVVLFNGAGFTFSLEATQTAIAPVTFTLQPFNQNVLPGTNVTLSASAVGNGPVRYQWRFEGTNLVGATNASYSFTNAQLSAQGSYSVTATDELSSITSSNAFIFVLIKPVIVSHPVAQTILQGGTARFSVIATGAPSLYFRWLRNGALWASNNVPDLVITNCQSNGTFRVIVGNLAGTANSVPAGGVALTVLRDFDHDGMADGWETNYAGFSTNNTADALLDFDGDGMINRDEYGAGTNPTDALSLLKIILSATNSSTLQFVAQTNLGYAVQYRTNLSSALWSSRTNIPASSLLRTVEVDVASPPGTGERYFRVVTPLVP